MREEEKNDRHDYWNSLEGFMGHVSKYLGNENWRQNKLKLKINSHLVSKRF